MSIKRSPAARVLEFFSTAPTGEAELVYGLVREIVRKRKAGDVTASAPVATTRKRRAKKVNAKAPAEAICGTTSTVPQVV